MEVAVEQLGGAELAVGEEEVRVAEEVEDERHHGVGDILHFTFYHNIVQILSVHQIKLHYKHNELNDMKSKRRH